MNSINREQFVEQARIYLDLGFSIFPLKHRSKEPAVRSWKKLQSERLRREEVTKHWPSNTTHGIAIILGPISCHLAVRDFDEMPSYEKWAQEHPVLAQTLPTVLTSRGMQVYYRNTNEGLSGLPRQDGDDGEPNGESRISKGYVVAPPSVHPDGHVYSWQIPISDEIPELDPVMEGLHRETPHRLLLYTEGAEDSEDTTYSENLRGSESIRIISNSRNGQNPVALPTRTTEQLEIAITQAIERSQPTGYGQRHKKIFDFARRLRSIPEFTDSDPMDLIHLVRRWHEQALENIRTKDFEMTFADFVDGWPRIRHPTGDGIVKAAFEKGESGFACPERLREFESDKPLRRLASACFHLQCATGDSPFFLSCRDAGEHLAISHTQANSYMRLLMRMGILQLARKGQSPGRKASEYRYLGAAKAGVIHDLSQSVN